MKNSLLSFAKLGLAAAALSLSVSGHANLLSNGDFENLATGWSFSNSTVGRSSAEECPLKTGTFVPNNDSSTGAITRSVSLIASKPTCLTFTSRRSKVRLFHSPSVGFRS
ncbi:MAG: hypothetical protein U1F00_09840 [Rhodoferax sp.]